MDEFYNLFLNNIWLFIGLGVVLVIVLDELLGLSRGMLGDDTDNLPLKPRDPKAPPPEPEEDPLDMLEETSEGQSVEDFLPRK